MARVEEDNENEVFFKIHEHDYAGFLTRLRNAVKDDECLHIPVLIKQEPPLRFLDVILINADKRITLKIDRSNMYILGYKKDGEEFFWEFMESEVRKIPNSKNAHFRARYEGASGLDWSNRYKTTKLSLASLDDAIYQLNKIEDPSKSQKDCKRYILVCIQFVSEAARITLVEELLTKNSVSQVLNPFTPEIIALEKAWGGVSNLVSRAPQADTPLDIENPILCQALRDPNLPADPYLPITSIQVREHYKLLLQVEHEEGLEL